MMNRFGKILVLGQTALSLLFATWAVMIYLQFNDYGWKEPFKIWETKDSGTRVASLLDKRTGVLYEMYRQKDRAVPGIKPAIDTLTSTMEFFPKNHQFYVAELEKVRTGDGPIAPKQLVWKGGSLVLDKPLGKPVMKTPVPEIVKSTKATNLELAKILADIEKITPEIAELVKNTDEVTLQLYGGNKDGKNMDTVDIGLYEVLENETKLQDKIYAEKTYLTPIYTDTLRRYETFLDRLASMKRTATPVSLPK